MANSYTALTKKHKVALETALKRYDASVTYESENRIDAYDDNCFYVGGEYQWPNYATEARKDRPQLTMNKTASAVRQVTNELRQSSSSIKVRGVDSASDPDTAKMQNGLIRAIHQSCNAETAYDWAGKCAVVSGFGFFRVNIEYESEDSFDLCLVIKRIQNQFNVRLDYNSKEPDGSDAKWGFVEEELPKEEFEAKYPGAESEWSSSGVGQGLGQDWYKEDVTRTAEYWVLDTEEGKLSLMPSGESVLGEWFGATAIRIVQKVTLKQYILTGSEVLEYNEYPGEYIPIVQVLGEENIIDGKRLTKGMVRDQKDPARAYNYTRSASLERQSLTPKAPTIGVVGQFETQQARWNQSNEKNYATLEYDLIPGAPPPQRQPPVQVDPGLVNEYHTCDQEMKDISGALDPDLNASINALSGVALNRREKKSNNSNFHFADNLQHAKRHCGRILIGWMPYVYPPGRVAKILAPDDTEDQVMIGQQYLDPKTQKPVMYDLKTGRYDSAIDAGPSYSTQREESVDQMLSLLSKFPEAAPLIADLVAKNMDWPEAEEVAERFKTLLPPEIASGENPQVQAILQQSKQQQQQLQQYVEMLVQQLKEKELELKDKDERNRLELMKILNDAADDKLDFRAKILELGLKYNQPQTTGIY